MKKTITLNTFRKVARIEENMMRAMMPRASAASPEALETYGYEKNTQRSARTLTAPLTYTMADKGVR